MDKFFDKLALFLIIGLIYSLILTTSLGAVIMGILICIQCPQILYAVLLVAAIIMPFVWAANRIYEKGL